MFLCGKKIRYEKSRDEKLHAFVRRMMFTKNLAQKTEKCIKNMNVTKGPPATAFEHDLERLSNFQAEVSTALHLMTSGENNRFDEKLLHDLFIVPDYLNIGLDDIVVKHRKFDGQLL